MHADNIIAHPRFHLCCVYDADAQATQTLADKYDLTAAQSLAAVFADTAVDAVFIASPTPTLAKLPKAIVQIGFSSNRL